MNEKIIGLLEDSITPFLRTYDKNFIELISPLPDSINFIRKNEEFKIFAFLGNKFSEQKQTNIKLEYYDNNYQKIIYKEFIINFNDLIIKNDHLHKYGAFQLIKRITRNLICDRDVVHDIYLAKKDNLEQFCLSFALKYQILTPFTSFICVIQENNQIKKANDNKIIIPSIESVDYQQPRKMIFSDSSDSDNETILKKKMVMKTKKCSKIKKKDSSSCSEEDEKIKRRMKTEQYTKELSLKKKKKKILLDSSSSDSDSNIKTKKKIQIQNSSDSEDDKKIKKKDQSSNKICSISTNLMNFYKIKRMKDFGN